MSRKNEPFVRDHEVEWEAAGPGVTRKVLTYSDGVMMVRVRFEPGAVGPPHSHPHVQCTLVESGSFDITIAGRTERLGAGDSFLVPPDAIHDAKSPDGGTLLDVFTPMRSDFV
jgi:quercetin dioxygenase-like cupin family protein